MSTKCPHCKRRMPLKKLTDKQIATINEFHGELIMNHLHPAQYVSSILLEFKNLYPSFKGSKKLIVRHLCQLGCRLDSTKIGNKTIGILIIK